MLKVYKLLNENSFRATLLPNNRLLFEFNEYEIIFEIETKNSDQLEKLYYNELTLTNLQKVAKKKVLDCFIGVSEYLGFREDIMSYKKPISICNRMYEALITIKTINPSSVKDYYLTQNEGYNENPIENLLCSLEPNYVFEIHIENSSYSEPNFFKQLLTRLYFNHEADTPPYFYWWFFKKGEKIPDSNQISIANTNTKVRRLGYFKLLSDFLKNYEKVSSAFINKKFEKKASKERDSLYNYKNDKGLIKVTKTGVSAKHYIDTAKDIGLLKLLNNVYSTGKLFKVYQVLRSKLGGESDNIFYLTKLDKLFFLETLLREDFLYLSLLLESIKIKGEAKYTDLVQDFQPLLLRRLNEFTDSMLLNKSRKEYREIKKVTERVKKWQNKEVYLEHVLMPRLNWLFDLDLVNLDKQLNIELTNAGKKLFNNLCYWNDINWSRIVSPNEFLNRFFVHVFDNVYYKTNNKNSDEQISVEKTKEKVSLFLEDSFKYFKTLAPNRVTASQAITYTKYSLYLTYNVKVGHQFVVDFLKSKEQSTFIFKFQKQYEDGYIQKKN